MALPGLTYTERLVHLVEALGLGRSVALYDGALDYGYFREVVAALLLGCASQGRFDTIAIIFSRPGYVWLATQLFLDRIDDGAEIDSADDDYDAAIVHSFRQDGTRLRLGLFWKFPMQTHPFQAYVVLDNISHTPLLHRAHALRLGNQDVAILTYSMYQIAEDSLLSKHPEVLVIDLNREATDLDPAPRPPDD